MGSRPRPPRRSHGCLMGGCSPRFRRSRLQPKQRWNNGVRVVVVTSPARIAHPAIADALGGRVAAALLWLIPILLAG
eukprot:3615599-Alexandrium_andersonii.AAC.1